MTTQHKTPHIAGIKAIALMSLLLLAGAGTAQHIYHRIWEHKHCVQLPAGYQPGFERALLCDAKHPGT